MNNLHLNVQKIKVILILLYLGLYEKQKLFVKANQVKGVEKSTLNYLSKYNK